MPRTFNNRGQLLLGDDALPPGTTAAAADIDPNAPVGSPDNPLQLPPMTVSVAPATFTWAQLLQPPYIYLLVGAIVAGAFFSKKR